MVFIKKHSSIGVPERHPSGDLPASDSSVSSLQVLLLRSIYE